MKWSFTIHGPARKFHCGQRATSEKDHTTVFKYPKAWPEMAMELLVRPRSSGWPSPDLVMEIFDSGCHLAPVGRGNVCTILLIGRLIANSRKYHWLPPQ